MLRGIVVLIVCVIYTTILFTVAALLNAMRLRSTNCTSLVYMRKYFAFFVDSIAVALPSHRVVAKLQNCVTRARLCVYYAL